MRRARLAVLLATVVSVIAPAAGAQALTQRGDLLISEARFDGPGGAHDGYVEITNPTAVGQTAQGIALVFDTTDGPEQVALPHITVVPGGSVLVADAGYGLGGAATPDVQVTLTGTVRGVRLGAGDGTSVIDRVGLTTAGAGYREGAGLTHPAGTTEAAWVRRVVNGAFVQQGVNTTDFRLVSTDPSSAGLATPATLGAPGPAGDGDPVLAETFVARRPLDPSAPADAPPNQAEDAGTGTITIRAHLTNKAHATVHALRARVAALSTAGAPAGSLGAHVVSAPDEPLIVGGAPVVVHGATLEQPPNQPSGGGINSALDVPLPAGGLAPGDSVDVAFRVARDAPGALTFVTRLEASTGRVPTVTVTPTEASPNTPLVVFGSGWIPGSNVTVMIGAAPCVATANALGNIALTANTCYLPHGVPAGSYPISAHETNDSGVSAGTLDLQVVPKITVLSDSGGAPGASIGISVAGFHAGTPLHVTVGGVAATTSPSAARSDADGDDTLSFTVPAGAPTGATTLRVSDGTVSATRDFTVIAGPAVSADPRTITNHEATTITGSGFKPSTQVALRLDNISVCTPTADASGSFSTSCTPGASFRFAGGSHHLTADQSGVAGSADGGAIVVGPWVKPYTSGLQAATRHLVYGDGFGRNVNVTVAVDGETARTDPATLTTDDNGNLDPDQFAPTTAFWIPFDANVGADTVTLSDGTRSASTPLTVTAAPTIVASPAHGKAGDQITFSGARWPNDADTVMISIGGVFVCQSSRDQPTSFSTVCTLPSSLPVGSQPLTATSTFQEDVHGADFTVEPASSALTQDLSAGPPSLDGAKGTTPAGAAPGTVTTDGLTPRATPGAGVAVAQACPATGALRVRVVAPRGAKALRATVAVGGRHVSTVRGKRLARTIVVRRSAAQKVVVKVTVRYASGRTATHARTFAACVKA